MDWYVIAKWAEAVVFIVSVVLAAYLIAAVLSRKDRRRG